MNYMDFDLDLLEEQEPCEDCISRQAVLDEISKSVDHSLYAYKSLMECVKTLPSVTPQEPKTNVALERYKDLQDYFGEDIAKTVLENQTEFKAWLERLRWNTKKVDELSRKLKKLEQEQKADVLDKIIDDIQTLRGCSCFNSDGIIDDVEEIIDKYRNEE